jgi:hypothetical protein
MAETSSSWGLGAEVRRAAVQRVLAAAAQLQPPEPDRVAARLLVAGPGGCAEMKGRSRLLLGRGAGCDLVIRGRGVSRVHAAVVRRAGEYWIEDLGSANGTWLRGQRIDRRRVAGGEELRLGGARVRFYMW